MGYSEYNSHHPIFYTLFIQLCLQFGAFIGDNTIGCAIYSILQMGFMAWIFAYSVCWLRNKGISKVACVLVLLFFALPRFWAQHAISMWKDPIFSVLLYFYSLELFDLVLSKGRLAKNNSFLLQCALCTIGICLSRSNGLYVMLFLLVVLLAWATTRLIPRKESKWILITTFLSIVVAWTAQGLVNKALAITSDPVETYGIPLQQVARTVVYDGDMTEEERAFLNQLMPLDRYKDNYCPILVDRFKWSDEFNTEFFNEHQSEFVKVWFSLAIKNPKVYLDAWELSTCGYWGISFWELNADTENIVMGVPSQTLDAFSISGGSLLTEGSSVDTFLKQYFSDQTPMPAVALCLWISLLLILFSTVKGRFRYSILFLPCIGNILTLLIASPIAYWPRYGLASICLLPICLLFPYLINGKNRQELS